MTAERDSPRAKSRVEPPPRKPIRFRFIAAGGILLVAMGLLFGRGAPPRSLQTPALTKTASEVCSTEAPVEVTAPPAALVVDEPVFPYLDGEPTDQTLSVGDTSSGRVVHAVALTESESLAILPKQRARDLKYGTQPMISLLEEAGRALHAETGTRLWIGNIGKRGGGDIAFSVSHNAGRDADVALSYLDASGKPIDAPDLVPLGKDGWSSDHRFQLDAKRTWITVRALVAFAGSDVEYIFLSDPLRKKILAYARDHREKAGLMERASRVLRQPAGAAPHDDHLHVRIYCSNRDVGAGCVDTGAVRDATRASVAQRADVVVRAKKALAAPLPLSRSRGALRLALLGQADALPAIAKLLDDDDAGVRHAAASSIARLGSEADVAALAKRFTVETDPAVRQRIVLAAAILGGPKGGELLRTALQTADMTAPSQGLPMAADLSVDLMSGESSISPLPMRGTSVRAYAALLAGRADRLEPVPALIALLDDSDRQVRAVAAASLSMITNQRFGDAGEWSDAARAEAKKRFEALWKKLQKSPRDAWVAVGFDAAGYRVRSVDKNSAWELIRATAGEPYLSYNARRMLARIADDSRSSIDWPAEDACGYYLRIFQQRRRFHLDKPPLAVTRACAALKKT